MYFYSCSDIHLWPLIPGFEGATRLRSQYRINDPVYMGEYMFVSWLCAMHSALYRFSLHEAFHCAPHFEWPAKAVL
jgi:hypothetical protein